MQNNNVKKITVENVSISFIGKLVSMGIQSISNILLTRILMASDYGVFSFSLIFTNMLNNFNDFGLNSTVVQKERITDKELYTALTLKLVLGIAVAVLTIILAPLATRVFDQPEVVVILRISSINFLIPALYFMPNVLLTRELNYKALTMISVVATTMSTASSVVMAYNGLGVWSLVLAVIINSLVTAVLFNIVRPTGYKPLLDADIARDMIKFSSSILGSKVLIQLLFNFDNFIVGMVLGAKVLGFYSLAFNWGAFISGVLSTVVLNVLFPTFSTFQNDTEKLRAWYLKLVGFIAYLGSIFYVIFFIVTKDFLVQILGAGTDKWLESLYCLRIFCLYGIIRLLLEPIGCICMALGRPNIILKANMIAVGFQMLFAYPVLKYQGIEGLAVLVTVAYSLQYVVYAKQVFPLLGINKRHLLSKMMSVVVILPFGALVVSDKYFAVTINNMLIKIITALMLCVLAHGLINRWKTEKDLISLYI